MTHSQSVKVRPTKSSFLGFTFWKDAKGWKSKPAKERKKRLYDKVKEVLCRRNAVAVSLAVTFAKVNQIVRGWINYFRIGSMKWVMADFGQWMRHKIRVIIIKQWKNCETIRKNLWKLNIMFKCGLNDEDIRKVSGSRLGWYRRCGGKTANILLSPKVLAIIPCLIINYKNHSFSVIVFCFHPCGILMRTEQLHSENVKIFIFCPLIMNILSCIMYYMYNIKYIFSLYE